MPTGERGAESSQLLQCHEELVALAPGLMDGPDLLIALTTLLVGMRGLWVLCTALGKEALPGAPSTPPSWECVYQRSVHLDSLLGEDGFAVALLEFVRMKADFKKHFKLKR